MIERTQPPEKRTALHGAAQGNTEKNKEFVMDMKKDNVKLALGHRAPFWRQLTATIVIVAFGGLVTAPAVAATRAELDRLQRVAPGPSTPAASFNITLREIREQLKTLAMADDMKGAVAGANQETARAQLRALHDTFKDQHRAALEDFAGIEAHLKAHGFGEEILQRHHEAVKHYQAEAEALLRDLAGFDGLEGARATEHAARAYQRLNDQPLEKSHKPFDPSRLPFGSPEPVVIRPADSLEEFQLRKGGSTVATLSEAEVNDPTNPAYLAETPEVVITAAIRSLAEELERNPVKIRNWVRNNIEYLPTWGSLQGAQLTLDNRKGNAFDIASLTIALLRASEIPARYVQGTVELPVDQALNWLGGLENPHAASNLLGQGGVPNMLIVSGGQPTHLRMEHVWVEAWVDFYPSRGAINSEGDSWVPMDASYKQYDYFDVPDFDPVIDIDEDAVESELRETLEYDGALGYIRHINESTLQTVLQDVQSQIQAHAETNDISLDPREYQRKITQENHAILAGGLPMQQIARGEVYAALPDGDRHAVSIVIDGQQALTAWFGDLNTEEITIEYVPATENDEALIDQYGGRFNVPAYLLRLRPELKKNGEVLWAGGSVGFATAQIVDVSLKEPERPWTRIENRIHAGGAYALAFSGPMLESAFAQRLLARAEQLGNYHGDDEAYFVSNFPKQLHLSLMSYFWQIDQLSRGLALSDSIVRYGMPSLGMFNTSLEIDMYFGMPRDINLSGVSIDVDQYYGSAVSVINDMELLREFQESVGSMASAFEHGIMQQLYADEGISSIRALQVANQLGLKIFRIDTSNLAAVLPLLNVETSIKQEIQHAVNSGKIVTIPEQEMQINDWHGIGYIVSDPQTGGAAYLISGGLNGGGTTSEKSASEWYVNLAEVFDCLVLGVVEAVTLLFTALKAPKQASRLWVRMLGPAAAAIMFKIFIALILIAIITLTLACIIDSYGRRSNKMDKVYA